MTLVTASMPPGKARARVRQRAVGRPERPVDPAEGPLPRFAYGLRQVRARAGYPTYRAMSVRTHFSPSVLSTAAAGATFPTLRVTLAYVTACGASAAEWQHRWEVTARELAAQAVAGLARRGAADRQD